MDRGLSAAGMVTLATFINLAAVAIAHAHSAERGIVLLLPTGFYITGGTLAVLASFLLLAVIPDRRIRQLLPADTPAADAPRVTGQAWSLAGFAMLCLLVITGFAGSRDPLANPLPLVLWTGWWVVFSILQCLTGDLWRFINPWSGPARIVRHLLGRGDRLLALPLSTGYLFAIVQFAAFAWFELVSLAPEDPDNLARVVLVYWALNFAAVLAFGDEWLLRGEPFSVFFRLLGTLSPFAPGAPTPAGRRLVWPGRRLVEHPALPLGGVLFVLLTLSTVSFDGFSRTFTWLSWVGVNPLDFQGRSAMTTLNSLGLLLFFAALAAVFLASVWLGCRLANRGEYFLPAAGRLVLTIIPISLVFHCAHYLTQVLVNGQYLVAALNDPLDRGWALLGMDHFHVTTSFLAHFQSVAVIWGFQTAVIVLGHIAGIVMAHRVAMQLFGPGRVAVRSQVFLAALMVGYTLFGLWLLSTPAIG